VSISTDCDGGIECDNSHSTTQNTLLNLKESLPRRVEAVIDAKGGPTPY